MAAAEGVAVVRTRLAFTLLIAISVAVAMKIVGILLVTAMLLIPAAAAPLARGPEVMAAVAALAGWPGGRGRAGRLLGLGPALGPGDRRGGGGAVCRDPGRQARDPEVEHATRAEPRLKATDPRVPAFAGRAGCPGRTVPSRKSYRRSFHPGINPILRHTTPPLAPHLLAVASPTADLLQFAREALWLAQERDLTLTLAVRQEGRIWARITGSDQADDVAAFAARWNITLVTWRSAGDVDAIIDGWTARPPKAVMLGARRQWWLRAGLPAATAGRLRRSARARGIEVVTEPVQDGVPPVLGLAWRINEHRPWYHAYVLSARSPSKLVAIVVKWLDGIVASESLAILFLTAVVYSANAYGMGAGLFTSVLSVGLFDSISSCRRAIHLHISSPQDVLLLVPFLVIAAITSNLSSGLRQQAHRAQRQAREARALFQLTRDIAVAGDTAAIFQAIIQQCNDIFDCTAPLC